jgi:hypothetical protein
VQDLLTCVTVSTEGSKPSIVSILVTDSVLISVMLVGLFRLRSHGGGAFRLGKLLWKQVQSSHGVVPIYPYSFRS